MFTGGEPVPAGAAGEQGGGHGAHGGAVLSARQSEAADTTGGLVVGCHLQCVIPWPGWKRTIEQSFRVVKAWPGLLTLSPCRHWLDKIQFKSGFQKLLGQQH